MADYYETLDKSKAVFLRDAGEHEMNIMLDDGVFRHIRFSKDNSSLYHFNITTWKGYLSISGDMGCFVFARMADMFEFFRGDRINTRYWSEKLQATSYRSGHRKFSFDLLKEAVATDFANWDFDSDEQKAEAWKAIVDDYGLFYEADGDDLRHAVGEVMDWECPITGQKFEDFWDHDFEDYTSHFMWCLNAIQWAIQQYDARAVAPAPAPKKMLWELDADNAAAGAKVVREILEGGPVQEDPPCSNPEPLFWYRPVGDDGGYEGPHHASSELGKMIRAEKPGQWKPLYPEPPTPPSPNVMAMRKALEWYAEQAEAMARHTIIINPKALEATVTTMALDGGDRAIQALKDSPSSNVEGEPKAILGIDPLHDFDLVALDCEISVLRENMAASSVDNCTVIYRHQLDRIASFIDLLAAVQDRWELVTHVRPSAEGDPAHYAFQVCATADEGALPVYRALSATATEDE